LLGLVLASLSLALLARQRTVQATLAERMDLLGTVRVVRHVVGMEFRGAWDSLDLALHEPDSVGLRAYRGVARVCERQSWNSVLASIEGIRFPNPSKDSVVFLISDGSAVPAALLSADRHAAGGCGTRPGRPTILSVSDSIPRGVVLVRFFERGSYHLSGRTLRYRRGRSGRQPLAPETLRTPASAFLPRQGGGVEILLEARRPAGPAWTLSFPGGGA
jgi:hypothetical protein